MPNEHPRKSVYESERVSHRETCPCSDPNFALSYVTATDRAGVTRYFDLKGQPLAEVPPSACNCDFGERLADALGFGPPDETGTRRPIGEPPIVTLVREVGVIETVDPPPELVRARNLAIGLARVELARRRGDPSNVSFSDADLQAIIKSGGRTTAGAAHETPADDRVALSKLAGEILRDLGQDTIDVAAGRLCGKCGGALVPGFHSHLPQCPDFDGGPYGTPIVTPAPTNSATADPVAARIEELIFEGIPRAKALACLLATILLIERRGLRSPASFSDQDLETIVKNGGTIDQ